MEVLRQSLGMTLSHMDLVLVRSKEKCSAIKRTLSIGVTVWLKGLILRHEVEGRDERRRQFRFVVQ